MFRFTGWYAIYKLGLKFNYNEPLFKIAFAPGFTSRFRVQRCFSRRLYSLWTSMFSISCFFICLLSCAWVPLEVHQAKKENVLIHRPVLFSRLERVLRSKNNFHGTSRCRWAVPQATEWGSRQEVRFPLYPSTARISTSSELFCRPPSIFIWQESVHGGSFCKKKDQLDVFCYFSIEVHENNFCWVATHFSLVL